MGISPQQSPVQKKKSVFLSEAPRNPRGPSRNQPQVEDSLLKVKSKSKSFPKKRGGMYFSFSSDFDGLEELCPVVAGVGF
ncbi:MAG TPA: hypothetical protein VHX60_15475, partial [Acidobacteriaceae bacterium]|nr:hypothetical protein [Acidobacteriaceae bacterium]